MYLIGTTTLAAVTKIVRTVYYVLIQQLGMVSTSKRLLSGMTTDTQQMVSSIGASYSTGVFNIHAGYYSQGDYDQGVGEPEKFDIDSNGNVVVSAKWTAWKMQAETSKQKQWLSVTTQSLVVHFILAT
eukprot:TRINITY_DN19799_c0_g1_i2.p1 TRINITY_DN19799_c0_g1~~TRINITY_DN19799_c0_g1_i2.p1  ORF type:complete len:128 (-),score=14.97 TRINITY_DN19799_c0_g1_i2:71-454(-)